MKPNIKIDSNLKKILIIGANGFLGTNLIQFRDRNKKIYQDSFLNKIIKILKNESFILT